MNKVALSDSEFMRYSAQLMLPAFGDAGQLRLANAKVLLIGVGGLGCPVAAYLAAAGIGQLYLLDHDSVELSNLQRQILYTQSQLKMTKVAAAQQFLAQQNPHIKVTALAQKMVNSTTMANLVKSVDLVIDCTDNMATRQLINRLCVEQKTALIIGAAIGLDGQLVSFDARQPESACYHCLYPFTDNEGPQNCAALGVLGPVVGVIGALQGLEAIKFLTGMTLPSFNRLTRFDGRTLDSQHLAVRRDPGCKVCG